MREFSGTAATPRSILGVVRRVESPVRKSLEAPARKASDPRQELRLFDQALLQSREQLETLRNLRPSEEARKIVESQLNIVGDPELVRGILKEIKSSALSATRAVDAVIHRMAEQFANLEDSLLASRQDDLLDVGNRIRKNLLGEDPNEFLDTSEETILVARSLSPSSVVQLERVPLGGILMCQGALTSHAVILARGMDLPCLVGVEGIDAFAKNGDPILLDGSEGKAILHPSEEAIEARRERLEVAAKPDETGDLSPARESFTKDGVRIHLRANISLGGEVRSLDAFGADGVGLFRTELIFMSRSTPPSRAQQLRAYRRVIREGRGRVITFRTIDGGGDKTLPFLNHPSEENPALGLRSIRLSLRQTKIFKTQLEAVFAAAKEEGGDVRVMFPMVTQPEELDQALEIFHQVGDRLGAGRDFPTPKVGVMIEVPAAALRASQFASRVDFLSLGTNDLAQFVFACDRENSAVSHLADPIDPVMAELIDRVVRAGAAHQIPVSVCGELGAEPVGFLFLLALGVREFSMNLFAVPPIRACAARLDTSTLEPLRTQILDATSAAAVRALLREHLKPSQPPAR